VAPESRTMPVLLPEEKLLKKRIPRENSTFADVKVE
jgi:hypothetical protein